MQTTAAEIAALLKGSLVGAPSTPISAIRSLERADAQSISFLSNPRYRAQLRSTAAACVIVSEKAMPLAEGECAARALIVVPDPYLAYARLSQWWASRSRPADQPGIHPSANVDPSAQVHPSAQVQALAYVGPGVRIGADAVIGPHCVLMRDSEVGPSTRLTASVTLAAACRIGARGIVHPGVVIGADGFGFAPHHSGWEKIEQLGAVSIGDDVEIGANTCIDRGALEDTVIEDGVKLDNLIQVGHNVRIGRGTAIAGCTGIAGSTVIGQRCMIGGAAMILGHLQIVDDVTISVATVVSRSILQPGVYSGFFPFDDNSTWEKNAATLRHLHQMRERLRSLEKKIT